MVSIHVPARGTTLLYICSCIIMTVSIHVPARGTTTQKHLRYRSQTVSIHVPARGTTSHIEEQERHKKFQSTFPQGERQPQMHINRPESWVSIHVPARGTTIRGLTYMHNRRVSIHVPARGTTTSVRTAGREPEESFNPRSRKGNDWPHKQQRWGCRVSIHVPARGTTQ